jgi:hypothetical protein
MEDPHVNVFDGAQVSLLATSEDTQNAMGAGIKWLVKSGMVSIQARMVEDEEAPEKIFMGAIAVGGEFLKGNRLIVGSLQDAITWNGRPIMQEESSEFTSGGLVSASRSNHSRRVEDLAQEGPGVSIELPMGVALTVNRQRAHVNAAITMCQLAGGQDGLCGNFNGIAADDATEFTSLRSTIDVSPAESFFS